MGRRNESDEAVDKKEDAASEQAETQPAHDKKSTGVIVSRRRARCNMFLPGGTVLVKGQHVDLRAKDVEHLEKHFKKEDIEKHILE